MGGGPLIEPLETTPTLWQWPARAAFGRRIPKAKFYERANLTTRVRDLFVREVAQVTWAFKLAPSTVGLAATDEVPEIEVLEVALKPDVADVSDEVLTEINRAIPAPLLLEIHRHPRVEPVENTLRLAAAPTKDRTAVLVTTPWLPPSTERAQLPRALDLAGFHTALLAPLMPYAVRPGESLAEAGERAKAIRALKREVTMLQRRVRAEKQFNRRAEINRDLRGRLVDLAALTSTTTAEESTWRS